MSLISERKAVQAKIDESGFSLFALASDMRLDLAGLKKWLRNGKGLPAKDVDRLLEWAEPKPEISALPLAALNQIATNDALERAVGITGDTLPEAPTSSEGWGEERQRVREAMESRRMSQSQLSEATGVPTAALCTWLKHGKRLGIERIEKLLRWAESPPDKPAPLPPVSECYPVDVFNEELYPELASEHDPTGYNTKAHRDWQETFSAAASSAQTLENSLKEAALQKERRPAEFLLLSLLERDAQRHLEDIAGELAAKVSCRVVLDWR